MEGDYGSFAQECKRNGDGVRAHEEYGHEETRDAINCRCGLGLVDGRVEHVVEPFRRFVALLGVLHFGNGFGPS